MMLNIAFVGHGYHAITSSSMFFVELLKKVGDVDVYLDNSLDGDSAVDLDCITGKYNFLIVWQVEYVVPLLLNRGVKNLIFVPMYDGCMGLPDRYWQSLRETKILCFSARLYEKLQRLKCNCTYARFAPDPQNYPRARSIRSHQPNLGFYWYRRDLLSPERLNNLAETLNVHQLTLQFKPDPVDGLHYQLADYRQALPLALNVVDWFEDKSSYLNCLAEASIYFAPRAFEGIGMSFLEAMAMGMVVVAPDHPTMNEYITHGHTGLLYDAESGQLLDDDFDLTMIGQNARSFITKAAKQWQSHQAYLKNWLLDSASPSSYFFDQIDVSIKKPLLPESAPLISVVTVVRNAADSIAETIESVAAQTYPAIEYLVLDGASTDNTVAVIERYREQIDYFQSGADQGTYDAMNKAAKLAKGHWILFMNAGDRFLAPTSLAEFMADAPLSVDFVVGHHVYQTMQGGYELHPANDFHVTFNRLLKGRLDGNWMRGIPGHQATLTRTDLLAEMQYDLSYRIAADHELMYRACQAGAKFHLSDNYLAFYRAGGNSWLNALDCIAEWREIAMKYSQNTRAIKAFYDRVKEHHHIASVSKLGLNRAFRYLIDNPDAARIVFFSKQYLCKLPKHVYSMFCANMKSSSDKV